MSKRTIEPPVIGVAAVYVFCLTLVLWPVTDFFTTALPLQLGRVEWRYASLGLMTVYLTTPILGVGLAMVVAFFLRHLLILRTLSILSLLGGVFLTLGMLILVMDVVQLREMVPPEGMTSLRVGGIIAGAKHLAASATLLLLGAGGWQGGRRISEELSPKKGGGPWLGAKVESSGGQKA